MRIPRSRWLFGTIVAMALLGVALAASLNVTAADLQATSSSQPFAVKVLQVKPSSGTAALNVVAISVAVTNNEAVARDLTIDLDIRDGDGKIVHRASRRGIRLASGQDQTIHWFWSVPPSIATGKYIVDVSVYGPNWSPLYTQASGLAAFALEATAKR